MSGSDFDAFGKCPNRTTRETATQAFSICTRYPDGFELDSKDTLVLYSERTVLARKLGCAACPFKDAYTAPEQTGNNFEGFHETIVSACESKFESGHYDDAVLTGVLVVRDRLRVLTGHDTASEAFGKGGLVIAKPKNGQSESNFQAGARFIMMANDKFRNELAHTSEQSDFVKTPEVALQFLGMSSLSMFFLDSAKASTPQS